jgi:hypothetical protein
LQRAEVLFEIIGAFNFDEVVFGSFLFVLLGVNEVTNFQVRGDIRFSDGDVRAGVIV